MTKSLIPSISELVGQRIVHILPSYGCGCIEDAYLTEDRDIHVVISFDNQRKANPFSLKKCINNNLISFVNMDIGIEKIDRIILNTVSRAEHIQNRQDERERKEVFEYLTEKRKVPFFVHFTPIQNLPSIFKYGIMPRSALAEKKIDAVMPDDYRLDACMDYISFSVSFPNYRVLYSKTQRTPHSYAVIIIDPSIVLDLPISTISYLPTNAASNEINKDLSEYVGLKAVKELFPAEYHSERANVIRSQLEIPEKYPTNPQAEVFICSVISPRYIREIVVEGKEQASQVEDVFKAASTDHPRITIDAAPFKPRMDWCYWNTRKDQP